MLGRVNMVEVKAAYPDEQMSTRSGQCESGVTVRSCQCNNDILHPSADGGNVNCVLEKGLCDKRMSTRVGQCDHGISTISGPCDSSLSTRIGQTNTSIQPRSKHCGRDMFNTGHIPRLLMQYPEGSAGAYRLIIEFPMDSHEPRVATNTHGQRTSGETPASAANKKSREITVLKRNDSVLVNVESTELDTELSKYATKRLDIDQLPEVDTLAAPKLCSVRLQHLIDLLDSGSIVDKDDIVNNLRYSISVLNTLYIEETRRLLDDDDDAFKEVEPDAVPTEVREWLAQTFTRSQSLAKARMNRPKLKSVAQAVRAGIMVDRIYRRTSSTAEHHTPPPTAVTKMFQDVHKWDFNVLLLNEICDGHSLQFMGQELLSRAGLVSKLRINQTYLNNFLLALETGYSKYGNPYHNQTHGADVAQTVYSLLINSGLLQWLSDIEVFATMIAALIHDYEHTGTTNNYHIMSSTPLALLYNDKAVLENHHVCAAFELMRQEDKDILAHIKHDEYREFRSLVIDMVLATDMSCHFQQIKNMKSLLGCPENIEKSKALSLILHTADISHPSKPWEVHKQWTDLLIEEFFKQGDREKKLGIPCSPLCDRQTTLVEKSQIGFIDFIVEPSFNVLGDMLDKLVHVLEETSLHNQHSGDTTQPQEKSTAAVRSAGNFTKKTERHWIPHLKQNRKSWSRLAGTTEDDSAAETKRDTDEQKRGLDRSTSTSGLGFATHISRAVSVLSKQTSTTSIHTLEDDCPAPLSSAIESIEGEGCTLEDIE